MKKFLLIISMVLGIGMLAQAQDVKKGFGVAAYWDLNSPHTSLNDMIPVYHNGSGFSAGAFYDIPVVKGFYVEPEVRLFYNTMIIDEDIVEAVEMDQPYKVEGSLRNFGVRIPIKAAYKFYFTDDMALSVFTGPQLNFGFTMRRHENTRDISYSLYGNGWRRFDMQWMFGVRFHYADNWIAQIEGGASLTSLLCSKCYPKQNFHRNTFSIGVGYIF